jgi:leucyl aminopeptidase
MKTKRSLAIALCCLAACGPALAVAAAAPAREPALQSGGEDPFRPVYVLMSRKSWQAGLGAIAREPQPRRDSIGTELVLARIEQHQLSDLSQFVHANERRCGGFFAFDSQAQADAFLRSERSRTAVLAQPLATTYTIDNQATVNPWLPQVGEANLRGSITSLSTNWANRYFSSTQGKDAATWIRDTWLGLANGRSDVSAQLYTGCSNCSTQPSVILTIQGNELANEVVVLGGHLDSISSTGSGSSMVAPGADDDGSGIATLTEVLRIAMANGWKPRRTVKFMGYAAEEVGLRGSAAIAADYRNQGVNVVGVMQFDMTDYRVGSPYDMQLISDYSNSALQQFTRDLFDTYLQPLGMSRGTYTCGYACSDHASWTNNGFPSAFMFEGGDNPVIHTPDDNLDTLGNSAQPAVALAKLGLAFLGELAKTSTGGSTGSALSNGVAVGNLAAAAGAELNYTMAVPANSGNLKFAIAGGSGNADLYVRFGAAPTDTTYDCRPFRAGNLESCSFATPAAGTWYVRLKARSAFSGLKLTPTYTAGSGGGGGSAQTYNSSGAVAIPDPGSVDSPISVAGRSGNAPANASVSVNITHPKRGELRVRLVAPDGSSYLLKAPSTTDSAPNVVATYTVNLSTEALNGTWKLRVADNTAGNAGTINSWSINF